MPRRCPSKAATGSSYRGDRVSFRLRRDNIVTLPRRAAWYRACPSRRRYPNLMRAATFRARAPKLRLVKTIASPARRADRLWSVGPALNNCGPALDRDQVTSRVLWTPVGWPRSSVLPRCHLGANRSRRHAHCQKACARPPQTIGLLATQCSTLNLPGGHGLLRLYEQRTKPEKYRRRPHRTRAYSVFCIAGGTGGDRQASILS